MSIEEYVRHLPFLIVFGGLTGLAGICAVAAAASRIAGDDEDRQISEVVQELGMTVGLLVLLWPVALALRPFTQRLEQERRRAGVFRRARTVASVLLDVTALARLGHLGQVLRGEASLHSCLFGDDDAEVGTTTERAANLVMVCAAVSAGWILFLHPAASVFQLQVRDTAAELMRWPLAVLGALIVSCGITLLTVTGFRRLLRRPADPLAFGLGLAGLAFAVVVAISFAGLMSTIPTS